jgi:hypothetical protein
LASPASLCCGECQEVLLFQCGPHALAGSSDRVFLPPHLQARLGNISPPLKIEGVNAIAWLGVGLARRGMPCTRASRDARQFIEFHAAPVALRAIRFQTTLAVAGKLIEQRSSLTSFSADRVRTHFSYAPVVVRDHLLFPQNRIPNGVLDARGALGDRQAAEDFALKLVVAELIVRIVERISTSSYLHLMLSSQSGYLRHVHGLGIAHSDRLSMPQPTNDLV